LLAHVSFLTIETLLLLRVMPLRMVGTGVTLSKILGWGNQNMGGQGWH